MLLTVFGSGALNIDPKITGQKRILMFIIGIFFFVLLFLKLISLFKRTRMIIVNKNEIIVTRFIGKRIFPINENTVITRIDINKNEFSRENSSFFEQYHEFLRDNVHGMLGKRKNVRIELKTDKKKQKIALNIETKSVKEFIEFITSKIPATH